MPMSACNAKGLYQPLSANLFGRIKSTSCVSVRVVSTDPVDTPPEVKKDVIAGKARCSPSVVFRSFCSCKKTRCHVILIARTRNNNNKLTVSGVIGVRTVRSPPWSGPRLTTNSDRNRSPCPRSKSFRSFSDVRVTSAGYLPSGNSCSSRALRKNCIMRSAASRGIASTGTSLNASWNSRRGLGSCLSSLANHARCPS